MGIAHKTGINSEQNILPLGFISKAGGIYREVKDKEGEVHELWLCSQIQVDAVVRDGSGRGWSRRIIVTDPDGSQHACVINNESLTNSRSMVLKQLTHLGLELASGSSAREAFFQLLRTWRTYATLTSTERLGWSDELCTAFVQGNGDIIGDQKTIFLNSGAEAVATHLRSAGTYNEWRKHVSSKCVGNPLLIVGVSLALSGPLLGILGEDGGGLHIRGKSSKGKSTILRAAVSVWGHPDLMQTWRATANGLEGIAAGCNSTLLALDELGLVPPRDASDAAYMLADGKGKSRADASGSARPVLSWRLPILSSGEISLAAKIKEGGKTMLAGQSVRLLDVVADGRRFGAFDELHDAADGETFSRQMKSATAKFYGVAGPLFVTKILRPDRQAFISHCRKQMSDFVLTATSRFDLSPDGEIARAVTRFAIIALAGELAAMIRLVAWEKGDASEATLLLLGEWLASKEDEKIVDDVRLTMLQMQSFLMENDDRFSASGNAGCLEQMGYQDDAFFYLSPDTWKELYHGHSPERAGRNLKAEGFLLSGDGNSLSRRLPRTTDPARPRYYWVRKAIMSIDVGVTETSDQLDQLDTPSSVHGSRRVSAA